MEIERFALITPNNTYEFKVDRNRQLWLQVLENGVITWSSSQDSTIPIENHQHAVNVAKDMLYGMGKETERDLQNARSERI